MKFNLNLDGMKIAAEGKTFDMGKVNVTMEMAVPELITIVKTECDLIKDILWMFKEYQEKAANAKAGEKKEETTVYTRRDVK